MQEGFERGVRAARGGNVRRVREMLADGDTYSAAVDFIQSGACDCEEYVDPNDLP